MGELWESWHQEAENQIKLAHPHEPLKMRRELAEKHADFRLNKYLQKYVEPQLASTQVQAVLNQTRVPQKKVAKWIAENLQKLHEEIKLKHLKQITPLDNFFY